MQKAFVGLCIILSFFIVLYGAIALNGEDVVMEITQDVPVAQVEAQNNTQDLNREEDIQTQVVTESVEVINEDSNCVLLEDFTSESDLRWGTVNDGVMGGRSDGVASIVDGTLVHTGVINTNGGGFSYVGTRLPEDFFTGYSKLHVRLNTNGREYAVNFNDARYWRVSHQVQVPNDAVAGWQEVFIDFDSTVPTIFSRSVESEPFLASAIDELNFILSDGIDGPFRMELDWIKVCE